MCIYVCYLEGALCGAFTSRKEAVKRFNEWLLIECGDCLKETDTKQFLNGNSDRVSKRVGRFDRMANIEKCHLEG
jgi:hypothetical protein